MSQANDWVPTRTSNDQFKVHCSLVPFWRPLAMQEIQDIYDKSATTPCQGTFSSIISQEEAEAKLRATDRFGSQMSLEERERIKEQVVIDRRLALNAKMDMEYYKALEPGVNHLNAPSFHIERIYSTVPRETHARLNRVNPSYAAMARDLWRNQTTQTILARESYKRDMKQTNDSGRSFGELLSDEFSVNPVPCLVNHKLVQYHKPLVIRSKWRFGSLDYFLMTIQGTKCVYTTFIWDYSFAHLYWTSFADPDVLTNLEMHVYKPPVILEKSMGIDPNVFPPPLTDLEFTLIHANDDDSKGESKGESNGEAKSEAKSESKGESKCESKSESRGESNITLRANLVTTPSSSIQPFVNTSTTISSINNPLTNNPLTNNPLTNQLTSQLTSPLANRLTSPLTSPLANRLTNNQLTSPLTSPLTNPLANNPLTNPLTSSLTSSLTNNPLTNNPLTNNRLTNNPLSKTLTKTMRNTAPSSTTVNTDTGIISSITSFILSPIVTPVITPRPIGLTHRVSVSGGRGVMIGAGRGIGSGLGSGPGSGPGSGHNLGIPRATNQVTIQSMIQSSTPAKKRPCINVSR